MSTGHNHNVTNVSCPLKVSFPSEEQAAHACASLRVLAGSKPKERQLETSRFIFFHESVLLLI